APHCAGRGSASPSPRVILRGEGGGEGRASCRVEHRRFADLRGSRNQTVFDSTRTSPLSPALSPEYREEGAITNDKSPSVRYRRRRMLKRTPFYDFHTQAGAKLVDFAGWEMPILYRSIVDEHEQTRNSGSIFDVSHMGRLTFSGKDAQTFLNRVLTRNVTDQAVGQSRYSLVCNESGGILD